MTRRNVAFGRAHVKTPCAPCNGTGQVPVDPKDSRKGTQQCGNCNGEGEV